MVQKREKASRDIQRNELVNKYYKMIIWIVRALRNEVADDFQRDNLEINESSTDSTFQMFLELMEEIQKKNGICWTKITNICSYFSIPFISSACAWPHFSLE